MKISFVSVGGIIAGIIIMLSGIATMVNFSIPALDHIRRISPDAAISLGMWRIASGIMVIAGSYLGNYHRFGYGLILFLGIFEIFVTFTEKDYTILTAGAFLAIFAGLAVFFKKTQSNR